MHTDDPGVVRAGLMSQHISLNRDVTAVTVPRSVVPYPCCPGTQGDVTVLRTTRPVALAVTGQC